jgi:hypothetical protein
LMMPKMTPSAVQRITKSMKALSIGSSPVNPVRKLGRGFLSNGVN